MAGVGYAGRSEPSPRLRQSPLLIQLSTPFVVVETICRLVNFERRLPQLRLLRPVPL